MKMVVIVKVKVKKVIVYVMKAKLVVFLQVIVR